MHKVFYFRSLIFSNCRYMRYFWYSGETFTYDGIIKQLEFSGTRHQNNHILEGKKLHYNLYYIFNQWSWKLLRIYKCICTYTHTNIEQKNNYVCKKTQCLSSFQSLFNGKEKNLFQVCLIF